MKKNTRILSATVAALLAVAPVVANSVTSVLADSNVTVKGSFEGSATLKLNTNNVASLVAGDPVSKLEMKLDQSTLPTGASVNEVDTKIYKSATNQPETDPITGITAEPSPDIEMAPDDKGFKVTGTEVTNFAANTNYVAAKQVDIVGLHPEKTYEVTINDNPFYLTADKEGKIKGIGVVSDMFRLFDNTKTGSPIVKEGNNVVTSGSVDLTATDKNVSDIAEKIIAKYTVTTDNGDSKADFKSVLDDIRAALSAAGIGVDVNGNFSQPANPVKATLNLLADSGKTAKFEITVNPAPNNVVTPAAPGSSSTPVSPVTGVSKTIKANGAVPVYQIDGTTVTDSKTTVKNGDQVLTFGEPVVINGKSYTRIKSADSNLFVETKYVDDSTKPADKVSKTVMHNAYIYDAKHKRVGTETLAAYSKIEVLGQPTKLEDGSLVYKIGDNQYVMADNIDGTKRVLTHNAYVYKTSKKRADKRVLRNGSTVTTYGSAYTFKNGKAYYRIGGPAKQYVKVANF